MKINHKLKNIKKHKRMSSSSFSFIFAIKRIQQAQRERIKTTNKPQIYELQKGDQEEEEEQ